MKSEEADFLLDPVFLTVKRFLLGRVMVVGLNTELTEVLGSSGYLVRIAKYEERRE